jgi:UDP-3-O-[3-hydroxymyristoyl] glucosamine N-acyltransferase
VGIAGSAEIGDQCQIGGATGILGHLKICDKTVIGPMSLVLSDITKSGKYVGVYPLQTDREWKRSSSIVRNLDSLRKKLFRAKN